MPVLDAVIRRWGPEVHPGQVIAAFRSEVEGARTTTERTEALADLMDWAGSRVRSSRHRPRFSRIVRPGGAMGWQHYREGGVEWWRGRHHSAEYRCRRLGVGPNWMLQHLPFWGPWRFVGVWPSLRWLCIALNVAHGSPAGGRHWFAGRWRG